MEFRYFCQQYMMQLSGIESTDIEKLSLYVVETPRLREPLFCYAYCCGQVPFLLSSVQAMKPIYNEYLSIYTHTNKDYVHFCSIVESVLETDFFTAPGMPYPGPEWLPKEYVKVYRSWHAYNNRPNHDTQSKERGKSYILKALARHPELSLEKICTDLNYDVNKVCSYIREGKVDAISWDMTYKICRYIANYSRS